MRPLALVCYTPVYDVVTQRSLHDDTENYYQIGLGDLL